MGSPASIHAAKKLRSKSGKFQGALSVCLVWFGVLLLGVGCQYDPFAHTFTTNPVSTSDVVGSYRIVRQTVTGLKLEDLSDASGIGLRADGTFVATNLPPAGFYTGDAALFSRLISGEGRWSIETAGSVDNGGELSQVWGLRLESETNSFMSPVFVGNAAPHGLLFTIGDGDSGHAMMYGKVVIDNGREVALYPQISHPVGLAPFSGPLAVLLGGAILLFVLLAALAVLVPLLAIAAAGGIISSSVLVGLSKRQAKTGFKALVLQSAIAMCIVLVWATLFCASRLGGWGLTLGSMTIVSVIAGLPIGLAIGATFFKIIEFLVAKGSSTREDKLAREKRLN